jgi:hypothetical protein
VALAAARSAAARAGPDIWDHAQRMTETHGPPASEPRTADQTSEEEAHDVLAAEAFAVPAPDPSLHHRPVVLPDDPTGIAEPHDVLAAEEFPMPAPRASRSSSLVRPDKASHRIGLAVAAGTLLLAVRRRITQRRGSREA